MKAWILEVGVIGVIVGDDGDGNLFGGADGMDANGLQSRDRMFFKGKRMTECSSSSTAKFLRWKKR
jgi:hypothetical protein